MKRERKVGDTYRPTAHIKKLEDGVPVILEIRKRKYILEGHEEKKTTDKS